MTDTPLAAVHQYIDAFDNNDATGNSVTGESAYVVLPATMIFRHRR